MIVSATPRALAWELLCRYSDLATWVNFANTESVMCYLLVIVPNLKPYSLLKVFFRVVLPYFVANAVVSSMFLSETSVWFLLFEKIKTSFHFSLENVSSRLSCMIHRILP